MTIKRAKKTTKPLAPEDEGFGKSAYDLLRADMKRHAPITPDTTDTLMRTLRALSPEDQAGEVGDQLRQQVVNGNLAFAMWYANKKVPAMGRGRDETNQLRAEMMSCAVLGMMQATHDYNPDFVHTSGQPGKKFVWWADSSHIERIAREEISQKSRPIKVSADVELRLSHLKQARLELERETGKLPTSQAAIVAKMNDMLLARRQQREKDEEQTYTTAVHTYTETEVKELVRLDQATLSASMDDSGRKSDDGNAPSLGEKLADESADLDEKEFFQRGPAFEVAADSLGVRDLITYRLLHQQDGDGLAFPAVAAQFVVGLHTNTIDARMKAAREVLLGGRVEPVRDAAGRPVKVSGQETVAFEVTDTLVHERMQVVRNPEARPLPKRGRTSRHF